MERKKKEPLVNYLMRVNGIPLDKKLDLDDLLVLQDGVLENYQDLRPFYRNSIISEAINRLCPGEYKITRKWYHLKTQSHEAPICPYCKSDTRKWVNLLDKSTNKHVDAYSPTCGSKPCKKAHISSKIKESRNRPEVVAKFAKLWSNSDYVKKFKKTVIRRSTIAEYNDDVHGEYQLVGRFYPGGDYNRLKYHMFHKTCSNHFDIYAATYNRREKAGRTMCTFCNPLKSPVSGPEEDLLDFITSLYDGKIESNGRYDWLYGKELDIYLPDAKLAIEFNGTYWHSHKRVPRGYHKHKSDLCEDNGIRLIHVSQYDWRYHRPIVESILRNVLGVISSTYHARKLKLVNLNAQSVRQFLDDNHLQGFCGATVYMGLLSGNETIQVMTFAKSSDTWEIGRLCTKLNTRVIGGTKRLFVNFLRDHQPTSVFTYAKRDYFTGSIYESLGFKLDKITEPGYIYYNKLGDERYNRQQWSKKSMKKKGIIDDNDTRSEYDITDLLGLLRVYDSGNYKYKLVL